ncbi:MAG: terminase family protein [Rhodothermia bacterium]|nr:terminase family protein [Rhodothermia bacterium]
MSTRTQIRELRTQVERLQTATVADRSDYADDPCAMMTAGGQEPDPWQREILENTSDDLLQLVCRQGGKSTAAAAKALHCALYEPGSLVLLSGPSLRQAQELFHKCVYLHRVTNEIVAADNLSALRLELANRSRIIALPGTEATVRGYSGPRLVILDEAAWIPDQLFYTLTPMLAVSGGQLIAMTTPGGKRGWFWREWMEGRNDYARVKVTAAECPRITEEFLRRERRRMPAPVFESEYFCTFTDTIDSVFRYSDIAAAFTDDLEPLTIIENAEAA